MNRKFATLKTVSGDLCLISTYEIPFDGTRNSESRKSNDSRLLLRSLSLLSPSTCSRVRVFPYASPAIGSRSPRNSIVVASALRQRTRFGFPASPLACPSNLWKSPLRLRTHGTLSPYSTCFARSMSSWPVLLLLMGNRECWSVGKSRWSVSSTCFAYISSTHE